MPLNRDLLKDLVQQKEVITKKVGLKIAGYETPEGRKRIEKTYDEVVEGFQDSHLALIELTDFLNNFFVDEFLNPLLAKYMEKPDKRHREFIEESMEKFINILERATDVRKETSNMNEELHRAIANFPPLKDGEG